MQSFLKSLLQSFLIIFVSEIADRTFILILLYSSKLHWSLLLITSMLSLFMMNIIAILIGYLIPLLLIKGIVDWIGFAVFLLYGIYSIYDSIKMEKVTLLEVKEQEEIKENEQYNALVDKDGVEVQNPQTTSSLKRCIELFGFLSLSEIGDKSELTTIAIAALYNFFGVLFGTMLAYTCTIILAICLGAFLSRYLSEKTMTFIGGVVFILFSLQILLHKVGVLKNDVDLEVPYQVGKVGGVN